MNIMLIVLAVVRTLIGLFFVAEGVMGFVSHEAFMDTFARWQVPYPEFSVPILAAIAGVCGLLLMMGWLVRPAALVLATILVEIAITGGRVDGGAYMIVPPLLFAALVYYAWRSGRYAGWAPTRRPGTQ
jgi:putative oxidoreductase